MLNDKKIQGLKPAQKRYIVTDGYGLCLRVYPSGTKTWVFRLSKDGKVTDITLGHYPDMSLKEARQKIRKKRKEWDLEPPRGFTFKDAFKLWCDLKKDRIVSYMSERRRLETYVVSKIGSKQIDEITAPLVIRLVKDIERDGHIATLKRVLMRIREIMDLAVCAGFIQHNPVERVSKVFRPPVTVPMASIHWSELERAMRSMRDADERMKLLWLWSCCSLLRAKETAGMRWEWIDGDVMTIPAEEMKKRREFRVPLTEVMMEILEKIGELDGRDRWIWKGRCDGHVSPQKLTKFLHDGEMRGELVVHGLRSIGRSWFADHGIRFEIAETCLSHVVGNSISRAYQRSDYLSDRRDAMRKWNAYVMECAVKAEIWDVDS